MLSLLAKDVEFDVCIGNKMQRPCDVCLHAKQTCFPFSQSESNLFELIHCDIYGAYRVSLSYGAHYF